MNNLKILLVLCLIICMSCNKWLDVKPETELELDEIYSEQQGFQDVLIGCYLKLKVDAIYGANLMYGNIEYLAQHWDYNANTSAEDLSRYNYKVESVQNTFSSIYSSLYRVIVEINAMLENIDKQHDIFEPGMYEIIKGEALAMRAFCHFDLLRLFGPMPTKVTEKLVLPYVRIASIEYHPHHTYQEYTKYLEEDLINAENLLKGYDPISPFAKSFNRSNSAVEFLQNRTVRFNYYAVKALEARFYLWLGGEKKADAYQCAQEVITAVDNSESPLFRLGNTTELTNEDYVFSCEHILSLYDYKLYDKIESAFTESARYKKDKGQITNELYVPGTTDIRYTLWTETVAEDGARAHTLKKFWQKSEEEAMNLLPLIRLSEMYLIAIECASLEEANMLYEEFCVSRDIPQMQISDEGQLKDLLLKEYNKEFYGEGQAFYAYKRMAKEDVLWAPNLLREEDYIVPLPLDEISYAK